MTLRLRVTLSLFCLLAFTANASNCQLSEEDSAAYLDMEFWKFDQTQDGWRKLENQGCLHETRDLIDAYLTKHKDQLQPWEYQILLWHSGQLTAGLQDYPGAIQRMEQTLHKDERPDSSFLWNPYVSATIAFLKSDLTSLKKAREELAKGSNPRNHINLRIVDAFIRCFGTPYMDAYSRNCIPKETNADRIRSMAVPLESEHPLPIGIQEFLQPDLSKHQQRVVILGEIHGTAEIPAVFAQMVQAVAINNQKTLVALEIPQSSQANIDQFIKTGDSTFLKQDSFFANRQQDGRGSEAIVKLLRSVSQLPGIEIFCMDPALTVASSNEERDRRMAQAIAAKAKEFDSILVLTGNIHSSTSLGLAEDATYHPMAYELLSLHPEWKPNFTNILVRYQNASSWNCTDNCGIKNWPSNLSDYSSSLPVERYFLLEDVPTDGHNATFFIRTLQASPPFVK